MGIPPSGRNYSDRKPIGRMQVAEKNRTEWISGRMEISANGLNKYESNCIPSIRSVTKPYIK